MFKENYQSAMNKIKAGEDFLTKMEAALKPGNRRNRSRAIRLVPALAILSLLIVIIITLVPAILNKPGLEASDKSKAEKFEIISENPKEAASYISVVYLDGYAYEPIEWLRYSMGLSDKNDYVSMKGNKLGEVTLDLKGKVYKGTPPDFSSTYDVGTEVYEIKNVNRKSAILVNFGGSYAPFYRCRKHVSDINEPLNLTMTEVFNMLSDRPEIVSVELRDEENGAWMHTSEDLDLISLMNKEIPGLSLRNYGEMDQATKQTSYRVPVNLIFADGMAIHMQFYPSVNMAYTFGGYIPISEELSAAVQSLYKQGSIYPRLSDLIPFNKDEISYLFIRNQTNGDEVLCENPAWSREGLMQILSYYRAEKTDAQGGRLVMTSILGKTEADNITVNFYETEDKEILTEIAGVYYKPVRGQLMFESLESYLNNNTDLGFKR